MAHFLVRFAAPSLLLALAAAPAMASGLGAAGQPEERVEALVVYGDDPCPTSKDDSIIVCARKPESERYRIPKALRAKPVLPGAQSWSSTVQTLEEASQKVLPDSCSAIGTGGATGCTLANIRQWYAERQLDGKLQPAH